MVSNVYMAMVSNNDWVDTAIISFHHESGNYSLKDGEHNHCILPRDLPHQTSEPGLILFACHHKAVEHRAKRFLKYARPFRLE